MGCKDSQATIINGFVVRLARDAASLLIYALADKSNSETFPRKKTRLPIYELEYQ